MSASTHATPQVEVQFDNTLQRVQNNIKTVNKYMADKLCRVSNSAVTSLQGKDQSTTLNHKSTVRECPPTRCLNLLLPGMAAAMTGSSRLPAAVHALLA